MILPRAALMPIHDGKARGGNGARFDKALSRHRHRHLRIEGRPRRRDRADRRQRRAAPQDAGPAARLGRAPAARRLVGGCHHHHAEAARRVESRARDDQRRRHERHRSLHAAGGRGRRAADERRPLRCRHARGEGDRRADRKDRRGRASRPVRQCADLPVRRPEDPLAEAESAGPLRENAQDPDIDLVHRASAHRPLRHRPLHGGQFQPALSCQQARLQRCAVEGDHRARPPAGDRLDDRHRGHGDEGSRGGDGPRRWDARDRGHHRRGRRGALGRRARCGRHDGHVWLDHLHHRADGGARPRPAPLVRALALSRRARLHVGARHQRDVDPLVPRAVRPRARPGNLGARARGRGRGLAGGGARAGGAALFFRRADADP